MAVEITVWAFRLAKGPVDIESYALFVRFVEEGFFYAHLKQLSKSLFRARAR